MRPLGVGTQAVRPDPRPGHARGRRTGGRLDLDRHRHRTGPGHVRLGAPRRRHRAPPPTTVTDAAGFATFQWTPTNPDGDSTIVVSEDSAANPPDPPGGEFVNLPEETECTFRTPDTDDAPLDIEVDDAGGFTAVVPPESIVTCQLVNMVTPAPAITIEKFTNGVDADEPTGPFIPLGDPVEWTYTVTNTGNTTLSDIVVTDTVDLPRPVPGPTVDCPSTELDPGRHA